MAKSKIVLALIATAQALAETIKNENLIIATNKLDELEDATHSSKEYKDLKEIVDELQNNTGDDKSDNTENEDDLKSNIENKKDELQNNTGDDFAIEKPKKLNYTGVKMVGDKWYSIKDNYRKSFATADECAKHFN